MSARTPRTGFVKKPLTGHKGFPLCPVSLFSGAARPAVALPIQCRRSPQPAERTWFFLGFGCGQPLSRLPEQSHVFNVELLQVLRWFKGKGEGRAPVDEECRESLELTARCRAFPAGDAADQQPSGRERNGVLRRMARLRAAVPERLARVKSVEPHWVAALLQGVDGTQNIRTV